MFTYPRHHIKGVSCAHEVTGLCVTTSQVTIEAPVISGIPHRVCLHHPSSAASRTKDCTLTITHHTNAAGLLLVRRRVLPLVTLLGSSVRIVGCSRLRAGREATRAHVLASLGLSSLSVGMNGSVRALETYLGRLDARRIGLRHFVSLSRHIWICECCWLGSGWL